eukprot:7747252-Pyramimonas_sp.AAC.1
MPHSGRAPQGAPPAASVGGLARGHLDVSGFLSRRLCPTRSSARLCTLAAQWPAINSIPRHAIYE